jgi:hypothetical protein
MVHSRSGMPIVNAAASQGEGARRTRKANLRRTRVPHATSETGRTLMLLLGFDVALMRRSTMVSIS